MRVRPSVFLLIWSIRLIAVGAVISGIILLIFDAPTCIHFPVEFRRPVVEAAPLLIVGIGFCFWLMLERPAILDFIKQGFIAVAFVLWGVDLLMPSGPMATFIGAVVIAIYVFDLAWFIEANLRKKVNSLRYPGDK